MGKQLTREELADLFSVSVRTVDRWRKARRISFTKIGGVVRFNPETVATELGKFTLKAK